MGEWKGNPIEHPEQDARDIMNPKRQKARTESLVSSSTVALLCAVFFALGCFVGRESVWHQLRGIFSG